MARSRPEQASFSWESTPVLPSEPERAQLGQKLATVRLQARAQTPEERPWLTADEATVFLGLPSRKALYAAVERRQVPAHRLGRRRLRFNRGELEALLGQVSESTRVR